MNGAKLNWRTLLIATVVIAVVAYLMENVLLAAQGGALLVTLLFWVTLAHGPIAVVAAADIVSGKWIQPYKREMLSVYPFGLVIPVLFLAFVPNLKYYIWYHDQGVWLNSTFFITRNVVLLLITFLLARKFALESIKEGPKKSTYAVWYVLAYVATHTIIAFDWVMSMEYPWISTLFGAYFFVEAFYAGIAFGGVMTFINYANFTKEYPIKVFKKSQMDMGTLLFGFSVFWAYQFYSQYLVIWYGNIPEEVSFLARRVATSPMREFAYSVIVLLFLIPFVTLLFRKLKGSPGYLLFISLIIYTGLLIERVLYVEPHLTVNPILAIVEFALVGGLFALIVQSRRLFLKLS